MHLGAFYVFLTIFAAKIMQRILLFLCSCALQCFTCMALAQVGEPRSDLAIGGSGGVALNRIDFDPSIKQTLHTAPTFGVTLRYACEKYFSTYCALQAEVNFTRLGWTEEIQSSAGVPLPDTYSRDLDYIQVPLLARLGWGRERRGVMFYIVAGPQIGFCIGDHARQSSTWTLNGEGIPDRPNSLVAQYSMDIEKKFDYGIAGGLGLEWNTSIGHFMLEGRYYFGLADIYGNAKKDVFGRSAHGTIFAKLTYLTDILK